MSLLRDLSFSGWDIGDGCRMSAILCAAGEIVQDMVSSRYASALESLGKMRSDLFLDLHLGECKMDASAALMLRPASVSFHPRYMVPGTARRASQRSSVVPLCDGSGTCHFA